MVKGGQLGRYSLGVSSRSLLYSRSASKLPGIFVTFLEYLVTARTRPATMLNRTDRTKKVMARSVANMDWSSGVIASRQWTSSEMLNVEMTDPMKYL